MMSSWIFYLLGEVEFVYVEGYGMNEEELVKNCLLIYYFVQNFNQDLKIFLLDKDFDVVFNCVLI